MLKILIADDHEMIRSGVKQILQDEFAFLETDEAPDTGSLIEKATGGAWDIIISDITMPGGGGLHAIQQIRQKKITTPILIVSMHTEEEYVNEAINLGASGFLNKDAAPDELIKAVKKIISGSRYIRLTNTRD